MATDEQMRQQLEELRGRIAELTEQLRTVTDERDSAHREIARLREAAAVPREEWVGTEPEPSSSRLVACAFCDGDGVYWVHDFEMRCKRCDGTGYVPKGTAEDVPERH